MKAISIQEYIKSNRKTLSLLVLFTVLFFSIRILFPTISYDTDEWLLFPGSTLPHWLSIGRYSLVILKKIFPINSLHFINVITCLNTIIYTILFLYFLQLDDSRELSKSRTLFCGMFLISSPIFLEQYYFTLQSAEVSFGMILSILSFITTYKLLISAKIKYALLTVILLAFSFGIYQSFVNIYIIGAIFICYKLHKLYQQNNIKNIALTIFIFIISLLCYEGILSYLLQRFSIPSSDYLELAWKTEPFLSCIKQMIITFGKVLLGYGASLNLSYTFCAAYVLCHIIKNRFAINWEHFYLCVLLLSPFLLNIITAAHLIIRSAIGFPIVCCFLFYEYYSSTKLLRFALYATILSQFIHGQLLLYGDYTRNQDDIAISKKIYEDCNAGTDTVIIMKGMRHADENHTILQGQVIGHSFFEWTSDNSNADNYRIHCFMTLNGYPYAVPAPENISDINTINFTAEYPHQGYIIEKDNIFYVNLGK